MSSSRSGITDVVVSMAPQLVGVITGFIGSVLIARGLGPDGLGRYALVMSLAGITGTLSDLGIGQTAIRYAARAIAAGNETLQMSVLRWAFRMRMTLVVTVTTGFIVLAPVLSEKVWHDPTLSPYIRLGLLGGIFAALGAIPTLYFQSIRRFSINAGIQSAQRLIFFAGIILLAWWQTWSLYHVLFVQLATALFAGIAFLLIVPSRALWRNKQLDPATGFWQVQDKAEHFKAHDLDRHGVQHFAIFQMISTVVVMITLQADVWMMGYYLTKDQLGIYSAATRFALPLIIVLNGLNTALWPRASALHAMPEIRALLRKTFLVSLAIALAGAVYSISAPLLAPLIFGEAYRDGILIGQLLCLRSCLSILICPVGVVGYTMGMVRIYWIVNLIQLAFVVGINIALLPRIGPLGAALALVVNDLVGFMIIGGILIRRISSTDSTPLQGNNT